MRLSMETLKWWLFTDEFLFSKKSQNKTKGTSCQNERIKQSGQFVQHDWRISKWEWPCVMTKGSSKSLSNCDSVCLMYKCTKQQGWNDNNFHYH